MRFSFAHIPRDSQSTLRLIDLAETLGFDAAWLPDQAFYPDPFVLAATALMRTDRIDVGIAVTNPVAHHPLIIARSAATTASFGEKRFRLGIGTGNRKEYLQPLGHVDRVRPVDFEAAVQAVKQAVRNETLDFETPLFRAQSARLTFDSPNVPVYVAGISPRLLETSGAHADGIIVAHTERGIRSVLPHIERGLARRPDSSSLAPSLISWNIATVVRGNPSDAYDAVRAFVAHKIAPSSFKTIEPLGISLDRHTVIRDAYWNAGAEEAAAYVDNWMIDLWAWIGTADEIAKRLEVLSPLGVSEVNFLLLSKDYDDLAEQLSELAEVRGHFAG